MAFGVDPDRPSVTARQFHEGAPDQRERQTAALERWIFLYVFDFGVPGVASRGDEAHRLVVRGGHLEQAEVRSSEPVAQHVNTRW